MQPERVEYSETEGVAVVRIERPAKLNSITNAMAKQMEEAWRTFAESSCSVAVLTATGSRAFTAGVDLSEGFTAGYGFVPNIGVDVPKPIVAAVRGWCIGIGVVLVQQADLCVASTDARFHYPEGHMGLGRGMLGTLASRMPAKVAAELLLLGDPVSAERLERAGFVNEVTESDDVEDRAMHLASRIAAQGPAVAAFFKANLDSAISRSIGETAERTRWRGDQLPGNRRLAEGSFEFNPGRA